MIHAICDFCGEDAGKSAVFLSVTPFQNFARYHTAARPYGSESATKSFVICSSCYRKHNLPNPFENYSGITEQRLKYDKTLDTYTASDLESDDERGQ